MRAGDQKTEYLITGGAGFIGSHLVDILAAEGNHVIVLDDFSASSKKNLEQALATGNVELVEGSILDEQLVERCMARVDVCVHLAAALGVQLILAQPLATLLTNVRGTDIVLAAAARHHCKLLFASSSEVYGKTNVVDEADAGGLTETSDRVMGSPSRSRWSYAIAKEFGEAAMHAYVQEGAEMLGVRFFNVVGSRQTAAYGMVVPRFVRQALAGEPLTVHADGQQSRCFTSVHDVTRAILGLLSTEGATGRVYNIGTRRAMKVLDLAERVIALTGSESEITFTPYNEALGSGHEELGRRIPDISEIGRAHV